MLLSALDDLEAKFQTARGEFASAVAAGRSAQQPTEWVRSMERNLFDSGRYLEQFRPEPLVEPVQPDREPESQTAPDVFAPLFSDLDEVASAPELAAPPADAEVPAFTLRLID